MLLDNNWDLALMSTFGTVGLGLYFSLLQGYVYLYCSFSFMDSVFGSIFFLATGFHGIHVMVGSAFIFVEMNRLMNLNFTCKQNLGFELSCWYWHFVDIVWLFLYIFMYWWSFN